MADTQITLKLQPSEFSTIKMALNEYGNVQRQNAKTFGGEDARRARQKAVEAVELLKTLER